jgi:hypothetical protein
MISGAVEHKVAGADDDVISCYGASTIGAPRKGTLVGTRVIQLPSLNYAGPPGQNL